jgi:hypothetical protein
MIEKKQFSYVRSVVLPVLTLSVFAGVLAFRANAANYYLDVNGPTTQPGASGVTAGSTYQWDDPIWTTVSAGNIATVNYVDGNFPRFAAGTDAVGSYTVNLATNHSCVGMILEDGTTSPSSTLTLTGPGNIAIDGGVQQGFIVRGSSNLKIYNNIVDGTVGGVTTPAGISFSTSGGSGGGSLFLYGNNTFSGGIVLATFGGANINSGNSFGTGPITWSTTPAVIADPTDPTLTGPITLTNEVKGRTTAAASTLLVTGAQKITFAGPFNLTTASGFTQTFSIGNNTFPNAVTEISGAINAPSSPIIKAGTGTLILSNSSNSYGNGLGADTKVIAGTLVIANPTAIPATNLVVDNTPVPPAVAIPAIAQYQAGLATAVQMFGITSGTAAGPNTGQVDLTNNSLVINTFHNTPGSMTVAQVQALVKDGYNGGAWNGPGINSSTAAADTNHGIGFADNTILQYSTFKGVSPGANDILVKYTLYGDADLDGDVDGNDVGRWATNFTGSGGSTSKTWLEGDWDYDGDVDGNDVGRWAVNFTGSGGGTLNIPNAQPEAVAMLEAMGFTVVPEPTGLALLGGLAGLGLLRRRGRSA